MVREGKWMCRRNTHSFFFFLYFCLCIFFRLRLCEFVAFFFLSFFFFLRGLFAMQTSVKLDILSLNFRGIRDQIKRRSVFLFLKDFNANIYFLQETYSELKDEIIWKNEWGGEIFFSHGTNHSKGVCILINPTTPCQVDYCYSNNSGRIVLITITFGSQKLSLCNVYAPNNQTNQLEFMQ